MIATELFADFNDRFFDGRLPPYAIEIMPETWSEEVGVQGECNSLALVIRLSEDLLDDEEQLREVLIHEMAHAATDERSDEEVLIDRYTNGSDEDDHDSKFLAELLRLLRAGAPVNPLEFDEYGGEGWTEARLIDAQGEESKTPTESSLPKLCEHDKGLTCAYCGERVIRLTSHWTTCGSAPGFVQAEAKTTVKALAEALRCGNCQSDR